LELGWVSGRVLVMPKGRITTPRKITPMKQKPVSLEVWRMLVAVTASQVISYADVTASRLVNNEIALDEDDKNALLNNVEQMEKIMEDGKKLHGGYVTPPNTHFGLHTLATMMDTLEINKSINDKYLEKCDCEGCELIAKDYILGKEMIKTLVGLEVTPK